MAEKIEVGYKPVGGNDLGICHKYILYTNSAGQTFYAGSYPQNYTFDEFASGGTEIVSDPIYPTIYPIYPRFV